MLPHSSSPSCSSSPSPPPKSPKPLAPAASPGRRIGGRRGSKRGSTLGRGGNRVDAVEPAGGAPGGGAAAAGAGGERGWCTAWGADEGHPGGPGDARRARPPPRAGLLRGRLARRHGVHQRLPFRHRLQLPRSSSNFAMPVEPFSSPCGYLCTSRQTFLAKSSSRLHIFHWRLDHRDANLGCSMCISRHHRSHW